MNSQPKWDIYESVVLLNGYLLACKKSEPRAYIIRRVSADLRAMAIHRGRKIDEIFRNENGISYQMQSMDSAYKGRKIYVPATKLFQETVSLYRNQNGRFQELLKEARYMIEHDIAHPAPNDTDVFVVDFNDCPDMSFARVNSLTYRGQAILIRPKWRDLYIALLKKLYADYSNEIDSVVGKVYGRASAPFVGNCHSISLMRSPGEFAPDRYVELNISATTVIVNIKTMLDICGTSYEDVNITYTKGNKDQMEELLKVQNIRTVFSAELLSIAGTIISDIFPNGLRKSSQIARKKFAAAYKNTTGRDFQDNIDLDALALQVGLEYEDKIYVPSKETNEWQYTYPHETFVELLSSVELMLSRENTELRKGIWIEGSYGTGKSRVVWALKNLLECSEKEFRDYFEKNHDEFKKVPDLEDKLFAQRSGKIVTVFRYNSGEITTIKKFITAVFDSVSDALDNAGIAYNGNKTLRGKVVQWLSDDANKAYFNAIISMPQYRSLGSLSGKNADDIIAQLNNPSASSDALLTDILRIGEEKGIKPFNIEMQDLKDWLTDIIESNQLKAIVFLWDEFSSFFKNNPTALDVFQSLAELANDKPFYMVIVTKSLQLITFGISSTKKAEMKTPIRRARAT